VYLTTAQFVEVLPLIRTIAVRTHGAPRPTLAAMRRAVQQTDRTVAVLDAAELEALVDRQLATPKLAATLIAVFGAGILLLAGAGLYALLASVVRARRQELAIRQVLGATPGHLRSIVLGQSLTMCGLGLAIGLAVSLAAGRYLQSVLYGVLRSRRTDGGRCHGRPRQCGGPGELAAGESGGAAGYARLVAIGVTVTRR
jgi:ABC-type antimicrobial peptide transport system permease subunit